MMETVPPSSHYDLVVTDRDGDYGEDNKESSSDDTSSEHGHRHHHDNPERFNHSSETSQVSYEAIELDPPESSDTTPSNDSFSSSSSCASSQAMQAQCYSPCPRSSCSTGPSSRSSISTTTSTWPSSSDDTTTNAPVSESTTTSTSSVFHNNNNNNNNNNGNDTSTTRGRAPPRRSVSANAGTKKRVSWDRIQTREYALVVGDHPLCQDGLPVSLGWQYHDKPLEEGPTISTNGSSSSLTMIKERNCSYVFPRRLSYEERRHRLCNVSGLSMEQVKNEEIELVVRTLKESWDDVCLSVQSNGDNNSNQTNFNPMAAFGGNSMSLDLMLPEEQMQHVDPAVTSSSSSLPSSPPPELEDPLQDMMAWEEIPGLDCDLTDVTDFEWTETL